MSKDMKKAAAAIAREAVKMAVKKKLSGINIQSHLDEVMSDIENIIEDQVRFEISKEVDSYVQIASFRFRGLVEALVDETIKSKIQNFGLDEEAERLVRVAINKMSRAQ
jgi:hypothetical protein